MINAPLPLASPARSLPGWRATALLGVMGAAFSGILYQSWKTQIEQGAFLRAQGAQRYERHLPLPVPPRAAILDRQGESLALSVPTSTLWVDPREFSQGRGKWPKLAQSLGISVAELENRVSRGSSGFAYLARQISPTQASAALDLQVPGLHSMAEYRRYYPSGEISAPILGFTNIDGHGIEGVELAYDAWLRSRGKDATVWRDNLGHTLALTADPGPVSKGQALQLTLDRHLQYVAYTALASAVQRFAARSGSAVLMDAHTGAILAMASYPSSNPNDREHYHPGDDTDRPVTHTFEPGSVMKPFAVAAALDAGSIRPNSRFNVDTSCFRVGIYCIRDDVRHGELGIAQILKYSSNIGAAKIALATPPQDLYALLQRAGFGQAGSLGLPGEASGRLAPWQGWSPAARAAMAYGYGISVSTLQLAEAYAAIAHGGLATPAHLIQGQEGAGKPVRVMSAASAAELQWWLQGVTMPGGTGFLAAIPGYTVAGKTGTSAMADGKGGFHRHQVNTTFVGFAPAEHPRFVMAVTVRDPSQGLRYGGVVAAPVFRVTMEAALHEANVPAEAMTASPTLAASSAQQRRWAEGAGDAAH